MLNNWTERAAKAAEGLQKEFEERFQGSFVAERSPEGVGGGHLLYMLDELIEGQMSPTKACRWLGYAQALAVQMGATTLEREKERNQALGADELPERFEMLVFIESSNKTFTKPADRIIEVIPRELGARAFGVHVFVPWLLPESADPARDREIQETVFKFLAERAWRTSDRAVVDAILAHAQERHLKVDVRVRAGMYYVDLAL